jgi:hypothetical protein
VLDIHFFPQLGYFVFDFIFRIPLLLHLILKLRALQLDLPLAVVFHDLGVWLATC